MKLEMDSNTATTIICIAGAMVLVVIAVCIYNYNVTPLKNGYSEVQQQGSQSTMWVNAKTNSNQ